MMACKWFDRRLLGATAAAAIIVAASSGSAWAQAALAPTTPAEIQPGHPPPATTGSTGTPQSVVPTPLPPDAKPDTPGGAARDGVITPPAPAADAAINRGAPSGTLGTPVIPPPGSPGGNPSIVPK